MTDVSSVIRNWPAASVNSTTIAPLRAGVADALAAVVTSGILPFPQRSWAGLDHCYGRTADYRGPESIGPLPIRRFHERSLDPRRRKQGRGVRGRRVHQPDAEQGKA